MVVRLLWLSGRALAAQARDVLGRLPATPGFFTFLYFCLITSKFIYFQREARCSENPYQILPHSAAIKFHNITSNSQHTMQTKHCSQFLHTRQTILAMLNSNYIGYKVSFIPTKCFIGKKLTFQLLILQSSSCRAYTAVFCACCVCSNEEQSKRQLFSNRAFGWKKGYFVTMNNRTSLREQLYCIHPQHTHSPCTSTCTTHPAISSQLPSTTLQCTQLTNTKHSWQNGTRCRDGVNVLWCRSHLVWLVFEGSIPTCTGFHSENFFVTCYIYGLSTDRVAL